MSYDIKRGMTRGKLIFVCTWLAIFAVSFLVWALYLGRLTKELEQYEEYQPIYAAEEIFREYFANADAATIAGYGEYNLSDYDSSDAVEKRIELIIDGKELSYRESVSTDSQVHYEVMANGKAFAVFTVKPDADSKELFGNKDYTLGEIEILVKPDVEANIIAPKKAVVKVNGIVVGDDKRVGDYLELDNAEYFPEDDPDSRLMAVYHIGGLFTSPEISVTNADRNIYYGVEFDKNKSLYDTEYSYRTILSEIYNGTYEEPDLPPETLPESGGEEQNPYSDFLYEALTIYEKYIHLTNEENDQVSWRVLAFFKPGTEIYAVIMDYYYDSNFFPDTYEFSNPSISDFAWNDPSQTSFSCVYRMKVDMSLGAGGNKATENVRYIVEVDVTGEKPLITSLKRSN